MIRTCKNKHCKKRFEPVGSTLQPVCSPDCAIKYAIQLREKKERKTHLEIYRKNKKIKASIMTVSQYKKILQPLVNHIARLIDHGSACISCGKTTGKPQGGHYHSTGGNNSIRFNLHNIFLQDFKCNVYESANITGFNIGLTETYGKEYQEYVEYGIVREYPEMKLSIPELQEAIVRAKGVVKNMKGMEAVRTPLERRRMRGVVNSIIGIYTK